MPTHTHLHTCQPLTYMCICSDISTHLHMFINMLMHTHRITLCTHTGIHTHVHTCSHTYTFPHTATVTPHINAYLHAHSYSNTQIQTQNPMQPLTHTYTTNALLIRKCMYARTFSHMHTLFTCTHSHTHMLTSRRPMHTLSHIHNLTQTSRGQQRFKPLPVF